MVIFLAVGTFSGWLLAARVTRVDTAEALTAEWRRHRYTSPLAADAWACPNGAVASMSL